MGNPIRNNYVGATHGATVRTEVNAAGLKLRLGVNNFSSSPSSNLASFTECTATGYTEQALTGAWGAVSSPSNGTYQTVSSTFTFTTTDIAPVTVYTWYITDGTNVLWSRNFGGGTPFAAAIPIAIQITLTSFAQFIV